MVGVKFLKMEDKGRFETCPLEIGRSGKLKTVADMIEFVEKYNTFFSVDTELPTTKIQQFKQGDNKEDYITQNDLKSDWTDCIILDIDRHDMVNPTNDDRDKGLRELSLKFGHVLYAESKTGSEVFKGRLFMFMSKKILKAKARMLLELWMAEKYKSAYVINHHVVNAEYFAGNLDAPVHIGHEYLDRASFNPTQKLNYYNLNSLQFWQDGKRLWRHGEAIPRLDLYTKDWSQILSKSKYKDADYTLAPKNKRGEIDKVYGLIPVKNNLTPQAKSEVETRGLLKAKTELTYVGISWEGLSDLDIYALKRKHVKEDEYPLYGMLYHQATNSTKTAYEWRALSLTQAVTGLVYGYDEEATKKGSLSPYLGFSNGVLYHFSGDHSIVHLIDPNKFTVNEIPYSGKYLPADFGDIYYNYNALMAPTGSGKTNAFKGQKDVIFTVPTNALGSNMHNDKKGFAFVASNSITHPIKNVADIPKDRAEDTVVMTYYKLAYLIEHRPDIVAGYNLVIDEALNLFKAVNAGNNKESAFVKSRDTLLDNLDLFKSVTFITADNNFWEYLEPFVKPSDLHIRKYIPLDKPQVDFVVYEKFSQEVKDTLMGRTIVYCNELKKAEWYAKVFDAVVVSATSKHDYNVIAKSRRNIVFTSVMREGVSIDKTHFDNVIVDTTIYMEVGVKHIIQAASRIRKQANKYIIIHEHKPLSIDYSLVNYDNYEAMANIIMGSSAMYADDIKGIAKYQVALNHIREVIVPPYKDISKSTLQGVVLRAQARVEDKDYDVLSSSLQLAGYGVTRSNNTAETSLWSSSRKAKCIASASWDEYSSRPENEPKIEVMRRVQGFLRLSPEVKLDIALNWYKVYTRKHIDKTYNSFSFHKPLLTHCNVDLSAMAVVGLAKRFNKGGMDLRKSLDFFRVSLGIPIEVSIDGGEYKPYLRWGKYLKVQDKKFRLYDLAYLFKKWMPASLEEERKLSTNNHDHVFATRNAPNKEKMNEHWNAYEERRVKGLMDELDIAVRVGNPPELPAESNIKVVISKPPELPAEYLASLDRAVAPKGVVPVVMLCGKVLSPPAPYVA